MNVPARRLRQPNGCAPLLVIFAVLVVVSFGYGGLIVGGVLLSLFAVLVVVAVAELLPSRRRT